MKTDKFKNLKCFYSHCTPDIEREETVKKEIEEIRKNMEGKYGKRFIRKKNDGEM